MKFALFLVLSLSAMAFAGPAFTKNNQIDNKQQQQQQPQHQQTHMTGDDAKSAAIDILKQWCFSSQMSQQELTASFKKLVGVVKSAPVDQTTEQAVMGERICQGALVQKSQQTGQTYGQQGADAKAHELIKDVYMDALISCKSRECTQQLLKVISSQQVDSIRASYYMTRIAVTDKQEMKDEQEVKQFAESFIQQQPQQDQSEAVERQKLFATTALLGKWIQAKPSDSQIKDIAQKVAESILERYVKPVSQQEVEQYKQSEQPEQQIAKKIAKRSAALKALANIPGHVLMQCAEVEQTLVELAKCKQELVTVRQSAIECLEQNEKQMQQLKQLAFDQDEPIEVRVAAYRTLMTVAYQQQQESEQTKEQMAEEIVAQVVKHCEQARNQDQDDQFVLYAISHLDNLRTSQQAEHKAIKETIAKNKQHFMQIQVLAKKLAKQLSDLRRSSRNYKLEQEFNQIESGLVLEGDLIYESDKHKQQQQQVLPKLVRVNMSMPIMGETVNVIELTLRQNQMDEEILGALKLVQGAKFNSQTVSKVVDSFKQSVEKQQQQQQQQSTSGYKNSQYENKQKQVEADLTIKVDGCTVVFLCADDIKGATGSATGASSSFGRQHERNTRSVHGSQSIIDDLVDFLKRQPINFNRGFNVNINERLAKLIDVDANILAGLRFESRAQGSAKAGDFEIVAQMEPRFSFEAVVGPAKVSSKKLLQRLATKTALGLRLRFKRDELVDVQLDLPMNQMELFTVESQLVEKSRQVPYSYTYLPESVYGPEDIYSSYGQMGAYKNIAKRSIIPAKGNKSTFGKLIEGKSVSETFETSDEVARATGLRGQLRVAASPKDMSFVLSAQVQKYEPNMQGYRVKVEKVGRQAGELKQYQVTVSTPGARIERTMSIRVVKQISSARTLVKAEIQSPRMSFANTIELVHDGRQFGIKCELVARDQAGRQHWRHALEAGLNSAQQANSGRLAQFAYRPFVQLDSTYLKRPIQLQGQIAYQQSPKSVISYELKCPTTGDFVQGKLIVDSRDVVKMGSAASYRKRATLAGSFRRSAVSPIELLMSKDLTLTNELVCQFAQHSLKVHNMADWSCQKYAMQADSSLVYKNLRKVAAKDTQMVASVKLSEQQQLFTIERKSADERHNYAIRLVSQVRPSGHQMDAECAYNNRRSLAAYKHKLDVQKVGNNKYETSVELELVDTERQISEKFSGRVRVQAERKQKAIQAELASRAKLVKLVADFESLGQHQVQAVVQCERFQHKTELRNNQRQFFVQSRTDNKQTGQLMGKMLVELEKPSGECKLAIEAPAKRASLAADLKLASGKRSSLAIQTGRFATQAEFTFDTVARPFFKSGNRFLRNNLRFRSNLKDLAAKRAYWMDSAINAAELDKQASFLRFDSPVYRADLEFDPREQVTKIASFARSKRSAEQFDQIYSGLRADGNMFEQLADKLKLGNGKLWMLRSIISTPFGRDQLKQQARRAILEYADRRQQHQHQLNWSPEQQALTMDLIREPNTEFVSQTAFAPIRAKANWTPEWQRPASMSLESPWMELEADVQPFGETDSYAKISALSRHPRSAFRKHESEIRYNKDEGYKAHMKHQDAKNKQHSWQLESDVEPSRYAKMAFASEKHGKAKWEHKWRKEQHKRNPADGDLEQVYKNKVSLQREGPAHNKWQHETTFDWDEPVSMVEGRQHKRQPRSIIAQIADDDSTFGQLFAGKTGKGRYSPAEYLRHTNARLVSSHSRKPAEQAYKLDFDYQPAKNYARFNLDLDEQMQHASELEFKPAEQVYKLQSRLLNRLTKEPTYELALATKPFGLATGDQEAVFVHSEHPMLERPISKESLVYQLFKQPMKLDYSDKYGRQASLDYDQTPLSSGEPKLYGLRQKRAAVFVKDAANEFEHQSSYEFYPETLMGQMKPSFYKQQQQQQQQQPRDIVFKTQTKYGAVQVRADSADDTMIVELESPVVRAKLVGETGANMRQLFKVTLDNKSQRVQLSKLVRELPSALAESKIVKKVARKFDSGRFEHQSELLVSIVDAIFKVKSSSKFNERSVLVIEAEWNEQENKALAKIDGERVQGQAVVDLMRKSAELVLDVDDKHTLHHVTRLVRTGEHLYSLDSVTSRHQRPLFSLAGKLSTMVFEPEHLFARRGHGQQAGHLSSLEAVVYEPREMHIKAELDCDKKEARVVFKDVAEDKFQETLVRFDELTETLLVDSRLSSRPEGQIYAAKAVINLPGLYQADECQQQAAYPMGQLAGMARKNIATGCQSEMIYSDKSGNWSAKFVPGDYVAISTPSIQQTFNIQPYVY